MQVNITDWRKILIPELSVFSWLFKNINFKILISIILSIVKQPQYFISYNIKSCYLLFFKFKKNLFILCIVHFHFTFLFNPVLQLFLFYFLPPFLSSSKPFTNSFSQVQYLLVLSSLFPFS